MTYMVLYRSGQGKKNLCEFVCVFYTCYENNASGVIELKCYDETRRSDEFKMTMASGGEYFRESGYNCQH